MCYKCSDHYYHLGATWSVCPHATHAPPCTVPADICWVTTGRMAARITRLLCSNTFLLSILTILGIFELGRNIFGSEDTYADYEPTTVNKVADIATLKKVERTTKTPKQEPTVAKEITKTLEVKPPSVKKKKYVRRKVLLLAYARYTHVSMFHITTFNPKIWFLLYWRAAIRWP